MLHAGLDDAASFRFGTLFFPGNLPHDRQGRLNVFIRRERAQAETNPPPVPRSPPGDAPRERNVGRNARQCRSRHPVWPPRRRPDGLPGCRSAAVNGPGPLQPHLGGVGQQDQPAVLRPVSARACFRSFRAINRAPPDI